MRIIVGVDDLCAPGANGPDCFQRRIADPAKPAPWRPEGDQDRMRAFVFEGPELFGYNFTMSTLVEIQEAITKLPEEERNALSLWLDSQAGPQMSAREAELLLRSLDEAIRDLDAGKSVPIGEVRKQVASWAAR